MAIKYNDDWWSPASLLMNKLVKEGRKFSWRKSYGRTKNKKVVKDFNCTANIYEIRKSKIRMLGEYKMPDELDEICSDLFALSLTHNLIAVDAEYLEIVVERSNNGQTNIDDKVMRAMMDIQKKIDKQLHKETHDEDSYRK